MVSDSLKSRILDRVHSQALVPDDEFSELTLELLSQQRTSNPFLDRFYSQVSSSNLRDWRSIPGLPTSAFKRTVIRSFPEDKTLTYFQTSGTTELESGRHFFETLEFYEAAILPNFKTHLLPDQGRLPMLILTPPPEEAPHSSLVHMMNVVLREYGTDKSDYFLRGNRLQVDDLLAQIHAHSDAGQPMLLLGTAFAFVYLLDALAEKQMQLSLSPGSRIMETGGFKGRTREIARDEFYLQLNLALGVPMHHIVNEYGMTELSSQFYDISLVQRSASSHKTMPSWARVVCVDPLASLPVPDGAPGMIRIFDLANIGSCCVLQTEDVGVVHGETFEVRGRVATASPRGCSLTVEDAQRLHALKSS